jgi:ABC-type cobalt transport system substrate-binding protein
MKVNELKKVLKPLIKECIKEVIFEDGTLSGIITEVAQGLKNIQPVVEPIKQSTFVPQKSKSESVLQAKQNLSEIKQQMQKASGLHGIFEGTTPMQQKGTSQNSQHGPMRDMNPHDPGVNIDGLLKLTGGWKQTK